MTESICKTSLSDQVCDSRGEFTGAFRTVCGAQRPAYTPGNPWAPSMSYNWRQVTCVACLLIKFQEEAFK